MPNLIRMAEWGHWGITFYMATPDRPRDAAQFCFEIPFACGAQGPIDGYLGSALRQSYARTILQWRQDGVTPTGAMCMLVKRWMYMPGVGSKRCTVCGANNGQWGMSCGCQDNDSQ